MNNTSILNIELRRRAAYLTFSGVIDKYSMMNALWMLEERSQASDKIVFINFFLVIAELLNIESNVIKTLNEELNHNINLPENDLPVDPMPQMLKFRGISKKQISIGKETEEKGQQSTIIHRKKRANPEMIVFVALLSEITSEAGYPKSKGYKTFNQVFKDEINHTKLTDENRAQLNTWVDELNVKVFKKNISKQSLTMVVQGVIKALNEAHGSSLAEIILNNSINYSSKLAAANIFSPLNFLLPPEE